MASGHGQRVGTDWLVEVRGILIEEATGDTISDSRTDPFGVLGRLGRITREVLERFNPRPDFG